MAEGARIVAFYQAELTEEDIKEEAIKKPIEDIQEEPDQNSEEESEDKAGEDVGVLLTKVNRQNEKARKFLHNWK